MNNIIKTISYIVLAAAAVVGLAFVTSATAYAAGTWANGSLGFGQNAGGAGECPIAMIGNYTTGEGIYSSSSIEGCWDSSISAADADDTVNVLVKLKNLGPDPITNARVKLSNDGSSTGTTSHSFTATISGNGVATQSDTVSFNVSSSETITYTGHRYDYYDASSNSFSSVFSGNDFFDSSSVNVGTVNVGDYGYMIIAFKIGNDGGGNPNPNPNYTPTVDLVVADSTLDEGDDALITWNTNSDVVRCEYDSTPNTTYEFNNEFDVNGSDVVNSLAEGVYEFSITCFAPDGTSDTDSVIVDVDDNDNGGGGGSNNDEEPDADTDRADDVDEDSAELEGSIDMNDFNNGIVFFVWGQDEDQIEDVEDDYDSYSDVDEDGDDLQKERVDNDLDGDDDYTERVTNLDEDERYYFQICVEYEDEDGDDTLECGGVEDFETDDDDDDRIFTPVLPPVTPVTPVFPSTPNPIDQVTTPTIITLPESDVTQTTAVINGGYNARGCQDFRTHFLVGTSSTNLSIDTSMITRGNTNGIAREQVTGLTPGATYYYQFVGMCAGIPIFGDIQSITTDGRIIETPTRTPVLPPARPVTPVVTTATVDAGTGLGCIDLEITNNTETVARGQQLSYFITWNNLCDQDFEDGVIDVKLAKELEFISTTRGSYTGRNENSVIADLGDITSDDEGEMIVTVEVRPGANTGDIVVVEANLGGDGVGNDIQDTAIEFDFDDVAQAGIGLGAFALGSGFFLGSVWGWLILLFLLALLILAARSFYVTGARNEHPYAYAPQYVAGPGYGPQTAQPGGVYYMPAPTGYMAPQQAPMSPVAPATMAPAPENLPQQPDYTVYRPEPFNGSDNA